MPPKRQATCSAPPKGDACKKGCVNKKTYDNLGCQGMNPGPRKNMCHDQARKDYKSCVSKCVWP